YGTIDLLLRASGLVLEEEDVFGLQEKVRTQVDAGIAVGGTLFMPIVGQAPVEGYEPGVTLSNAVLEFAIPEKRPPSPPLRLPIHPRFVDLGLTIGSNVHAKPPQMDLLVDGGGVVAGELGKNLSVGLDVTVKEGSINLYASRLRIEPGAGMVLRFQPPNPPEFLLSGFKAMTSVMATSPLGRRERYKITITASGNVMNLTEKSIAFSSDPEGLSREQIIAALGHVQGLLNTAQGDFQREFGNALRGVASSALFMPVERLFTEQLGFEEFSIESGAFAPLSLYLSRRLFSNFYMSFFQRLQATANVQEATWQFLLGYRFKQFYSLSVGIDNQQTASGELTFTRAISL
ncbi:MAG: translocation/assembly module TamB domain-containing protein, partial [Armatimonadota bacterium]